jgi:periplasmic glucans biosynthesis protein
VFRTIYLFAGLAITQSVCAQNWEREDVGVLIIQNRAKDIASRPYKAPSIDSQPAWIKKLTYDQYRDIRFNPEHALWVAKNFLSKPCFSTLAISFEN